MPCRKVKVTKPVDIDLPEGQSWTQVYYVIKPSLKGRILQAMRALKALLT